MSIKEKILYEKLLNENDINYNLARNKNCITGGKNYLYTHITNAFKKAISIDIIVAFLMESGARLLEEEFKFIANSKIPIRILTGNYLNITEPSALYLLKSILGDKADIRLYVNKAKSFHPKAYIFNYKNGGDIFIGSSNISKSAMTDGIEWNYRITKDRHEDDFKVYKNAFDNLFYNESIILNDEELQKYSKCWRKPKLYKQIEISGQNEMFQIVL